MKTFICILILGLSYTIGNCQEISGPVLMKNLEGKYEGELKKGLAQGDGKAVGIDTYEGEFHKGKPNGEGIYTFSNGDFYKGNFVNGLFSGKGTMTYKRATYDSIVAGYWDEGKYMGKVKFEPYVISNKTGIVDPRVSLVSEGSTVELVVFDPFNKYIMPTVIATGNYFQRNSYSRLYYEQVTFPLDLDISYSCSNKMRSGIIYNTIRIRINKPGNWTITLKNQ
jgi:hypothetical protein